MFITLVSAGGYFEDNTAREKMRTKIEMRRSLAETESTRVGKESGSGMDEGERVWGDASEHASPLFNLQDFSLS